MLKVGRIYEVKKDCSVEIVKCLAVHEFVSMIEYLNPKIGCFYLPNEFIRSWKVRSLNSVLAKSLYT
jgi:hypothetical protein